MSKKRNKNPYNLFKVREKYGFYYQNISIIGTFFLLGLYRHYNITLIQLRTLVIIPILTSLLITTIFYKFYKRELNIVWAIFHNVSYGFIILYVIILTNDLFSNKKIQYQEYRIENVYLDEVTQYKGIGESGLRPIIIVIIDQKPKKIIFHVADTKRVLSSQHVKLGLKKGFWGFKIIKRIKFLEDNY